MRVKKSPTRTSRQIIFVIVSFLLSSILISAPNRLDGCASSASILQYKWMATKLPPGSSGAIIGDVNADGIEEILQAGIGRVTLLSGKNGTRLWSVSDSSIDEGCQPQMADLDNNGRLEIVVPLQNPAGILALRWNGIRYWRISGLGKGSWAGPVVADIDQSGYPTIFCASTDVYQGLKGTGRITALSYDGKIKAQTFAWRPCEGGLSLADADNDGEIELFMGDRNMYFSSDNGYGKGVRCLWARNLTDKWNYPDILCSSHKPMLADVNKDGRLEVIVGHQNGGIVILNSSDGHAIKKALGIPNDAPVHYQPSVYDVDRDGNLEMFLADGFHNDTSNDVVVWDLARWKIDARMSIGLCKYGPQLGNVNGDGDLEIIAANYTGLFIYDKTYTLIAQFTGLIGILNYAVVQDIDRDGYNEVIVTSEYPELNRGTVYAFDTPASSSSLRPRTEVQFYSERRLGAAEYVPLPARARPMPVVVSDNDSDTSLFDYAPSQGTPRLVLSNRNLICYNQSTYDVEGDKVTNIYNWYKNGVSYTNLVMPFDTQGSKAVRDYSGRNSDGMVSGNVAWTANGRVGGAYEFKGGHIKIPDTSVLDGNGLWPEITIELWIYLTADQSGTRALAKLPSYEIGIASGNRVFAGVWLNTGVWNVSGYHRVQSSLSLTKFTWYHIALTYKSGTGLRLYVNGVLTVSQAASGNLQTSGSEPLYIGWFDYFKGRIDEVKIYPRSLSAPQVKQNYLDNRYGSSSSSTIVHQETGTGDAWKCAVIPSDSQNDGTQKYSNLIVVP